MPIKGSLPLGFLSQGTVIFGDFTERAAVGDLLTLSPLNLEFVPLPEAPRFWGLEDVSPGGEWLVYDHVEDVQHEYDSKLVIMGAKGKVHSLMPWAESSQFVLWLDSSRLVFVLDADSSGRAEIISPFTLERRSISPELPDFWWPTKFYYGFWAVAYDQTLTRAAYMRGDELPVEFILRDLEKGVDLWTWNRYSTAAIRPEWSPSGQKIAVAAMDQSERLELAIVEYDGRATKSIDLKDYWGAPLRELRWSPDGRYLAMAPLDDKPFLLLDTATSRLIDFCISSDAARGHVLWSPDSTQVIVPRSGYPSIVLDLSRGAAAHLTIDEDFQPVAWLTDSP